MGDMNDDPMDESMETLGARKYAKQVKKGDFYNPWWETLEDKGVGTLLYRGNGICSIRLWFPDPC